MGSLMVGWSSPLLSEQKVLARMNKSVTKEEINQFWKSQSITGDEKGDASFACSPYGSPSKSPVYLNDEEMRKASSPLSRSFKDSWLSTNRPQCVPNSPGGDVPCERKEGEETPGKQDKTDDWWTRSNSAYLNELPRDDVYGTTQKYTAQFDVAQIATGTA